jgi:hypothetical protein
MSRQFASFDRTNQVQPDLSADTFQAEQTLTAKDRKNEEARK